ncbi:MAG: alpha-galactosidase [Clostridia bacterium]|nr:alpha-galactosidase [Clostridia bacterium]
MIIEISEGKLHADFEVGDDGLVYLLNLSNHGRAERKTRRSHRIVNVHVSGENPPDHYSAKHTGSSREATLKYVTHRLFDTKKGKKLEFDLADETMALTAHYEFYRGTSSVRSWCTVKNTGDNTLGLEYVSSLAYAGFDEGRLSPNDKINVYIPYNSWCREVNWQKRTLTEAGLFYADRQSFGRINLFNTGFHSTKEYLPMGAVENTETECVHLWQIESCGSWQWEIAESSENVLYFKLSGPCEQENFWYKELKSGESFESIKAALSIGKDFGDALASMTEYRRAIFVNNKENSALPVIFNDYLHCLWADPTEEKEFAVIDLAAKTGAEYYMLDGGWYGDGQWWDTVGEWLPSKNRFPRGIKVVLDYARSKGMIPGIWLEFESIGVNSPAAKRLPDECFIMRHGKRAVDRGRYILDFRNEQARAHCTEAVSRVIEEYGAAYIKNDYNVECGIGTDLDSDSFGDGLLEHNRAFLKWYDEIREKFPHVIFENCASGGLRMDYATLEKQHVQSMSDQEDYRITARISAAASTAVLPEQAAIWATPIEALGENASAMTMTSSLLQRIHLSGDIMNWSDKTMDLVKEAVSVYKSIRADIPHGIPYYPLGTIPSYTDKWLVSAYKYTSCRRMTVCRLDSEEASVNIPADFDFSEAKVLYPSNNKCTIEKTDGAITVTLPEKYTSVLIELL